MAKKFVGPPDRSAYLPPNLPSERSDGHFVPDQHLLARIPCTRYWHFERRPVVNDLPPPGVPAWLRRFDWLVGWEHGWASTSEFPKSVFCHPNALPDFVRFLRTNFSAGVRKGSVIAFGGEDTNLSAQNLEDLKEVSSFFEGIYYEAKDIQHPFVQTMVCGVNEFYCRGHEELFRSLIASPNAKKPTIVAGWGAWWPKLNDSIRDRQEAIQLSKSSDLVDFGVSDFPDWLERLHQQQFMLCPLGNGVQAPKMIEALLLRCIPILTDYPASRELKRIGLPIVVVRSWSDIDRSLLQKVSKDLIPKMEEFHQKLLDLDDWWEFSFGTFNRERAITTAT